MQDMGFWWGHESTGTVAANGNPNGPCPQIVPGYPCERWGSNMTLINAGWSTKGKFRAGGAISFDGLNSYGVAKHIELWEEKKAVVNYRFRPSQFEPPKPG